MTCFIELHKANSEEPILVNVDSIGFIEAYNEGTSILHLRSTFVTSSNGDVRGFMETLYISESYDAIKTKIKNYE